MRTASGRPKSCSLPAQLAQDRGKGPVRPGARPLPCHEAAARDHGGGVPEQLAKGRRITSDADVGQTQALGGQELAQSLHNRPSQRLRNRGEGGALQTPVPGTG